MVGDVPEERGIGLVQHHVEVLYRMHALEALPVLEPHHLADLGGKGLVHVGLDLPGGRFRRQTRVRVVLELKLGPDDEVHNVWIDAVGPVVVQDLNVL